MITYDLATRTWLDRETGEVLEARKARRKVDRTLRAVELVAVGAVHEASVRSLASPDTTYTVRLDPPDCTCPDRAFRRATCKHLLGAAIASGQLGRLLKAEAGRRAG